MFGPKYDEYLKSLSYGIPMLIFLLAKPIEIAA
jgi:hypothetical protein